VLFGDEETAGFIDEQQLRLVLPELYPEPSEFEVEGSSTGNHSDSPMPTLHKHGKQRKASLRAAQQENEEAQIRRVMRECSGNRTEAARQLGIGRTTLWRKLRAHGGPV